MDLSWLYRPGLVATEKCAGQPALVSTSAAWPRREVPFGQKCSLQSSCVRNVTSDQDLKAEVRFPPRLVLDGSFLGGGGGLLTSFFSREHVDVQVRVFQDWRNGMDQILIRRDQWIVVIYKEIYSGKRRKRIGPRMEPCGTPNQMVCTERFTPFTHTNWDPSDR
jgi:hypothetical protein